MSIISGTAYWAKVVAPNTTFDSDGTWSIDVCNLDKKNLDIAKADGLSIKNKEDDRGDFVSLKRHVRNQKTGEKNRPPTLLDSQKRAMMDTLIGNGSTVKVKYGPYNWEFGGRKGVTGRLDAVQVIDLVRYSSDGGEEDFEIVNNGFSVEDSDEDITLAS